MTTLNRGLTMPSVGQVKNAFAQAKTTIGDMKVIGVIGVAIIQAVVYGMASSITNHMGDLSIGMNRTDTELSLMIGTHQAVLFGSQLIIHPLLLMFSKSISSYSLFNLMIASIGLIFWVVGYCVTLFWSDHYTIFTGVLNSFGAFGGGLLFWNSWAALFSIARDMANSSKISSYGFPLITPMIFIGLYPLLQDVSESVGYTPGNLWPIEQTTTIVSSVFYLIIGILLVNLSSNDITKDKPVPSTDKNVEIKWSFGDRTVSLLHFLSIVCMTCGNYNPTIWLREESTSQGFLNSDGLPEDEQMISSMNGWGGACMRVLFLVILVGVTKWKPEWTDNFVSGSIILHLLGAMACIVPWAMGSLNTYIGYLLWSFFYGGTSSTAFMFFFMLFASVWSPGEGVPVVNAHHTHMTRLTIFSLAITLGIGLSITLTELVYREPANGLHLPLSVSAGMMGGAALFEIIAWGMTYWKVAQTGEVDKKKA